MGTLENEPAGSAPLTPATLLRRFVRDRHGAVAIEFAILAPLFFLMLFAILESCIAFAAQQLMINATDDIARQFRTGQLRPAADLDEEKLHTLLCGRMFVLFPDDCPNLELDLRNFDTYEDAAAIFDGGVIPAEYKFEPGPTQSKNVLRVVYRWPVIMDFMRRTLTGEPDGTLLLFATATWQNEPF